MARPEAPTTIRRTAAPATPRPRLVVSDLYAVRSGRELWKNVSAAFDAGTTTSIWGPSGVGKSTLLACLGLLDTVTSGTITLDGDELTRTRGRTRRHLHRDVFGFLFQDHGLVDDWTVAKNLDVALVARRVPRRQRAGRRSAALRRVGLDGVRTTKASRLSGGERQRVALARLLLHEPRVVLADEPTASLDDANAEMVVDVLRAFAEGGAVVVVATHDERVITASDQVLELAGTGLHEAR